MRPAVASDFLEWDVRNWSAALEFWQTHTTHTLAGCSALEVGSRSGGLSLWLALQGARVVCSDVVGPTPKALERHRAHGVSHLIEYRSIDATSIPFEAEFDVVLFKSVLGAIGHRGGMEGQAKAIDQMHRALKRGGELLFAENLKASPLHRFFRRRFVEWGARWRYPSIGEMKKILSPFSALRFRTLGVAGVLGRSEAQRNLLGVLDRAVLDHIVPERWRYIMVGVARK